MCQENDQVAPLSYAHRGQLHTGRKFNHPLRSLETLMEDQTPEAASFTTDAEIEEHFRKLVEKSESARKEGNHWAAQKYATEAHKWAMDQRIRLQRLAHARDELVTARRRLEASWDKDRECETVDELREKHPEFKSVITTWEKAVQLVEELESVPDPAEAVEAPSKKSSQRARPGNRQ
jgi:hypothetical protein